MDLWALETKSAADWIAANAGEEWIGFKCDTITSMVEEIVSAVRGIEPDILINIHVVPWRTNDFDGAITRIAGQNRADLGAVADYLSPMAYSFMLHRPPEWISPVVQDFDWVADCPILPSIQSFPSTLARGGWSRIRLLSGTPMCSGCSTTAARP